jgi:hypothetical protein
VADEATGDADGKAPARRPRTRKAPAAQTPDVDDAAAVEAIAGAAAALAAARGQSEAAAAEEPAPPKRRRAPARRKTAKPADDEGPSDAVDDGVESAA